jgi:long-subunit fatty acid transport protein
VLDERVGGAAGLSLAGAGATVIQDPSALWTNPALLARATSRIALHLELASDHRAVFRTLAVNDVVEARDAPGVIAAPALSFAHPLVGSWLWAALGYRFAPTVKSHYPPQITETNSERDAPARYRGTGLEIAEHVVSFGLAARWRSLSVGAMLEVSHLSFRHVQSLWAGREADRQLLENPLLDVVATVEGENSLAARGLFGLSVQPHPWVQVGLALHTPITVGVRGTVSLEPSAQAPPGHTVLQAESGAARLDLPLPLGFRGGVSLGPPRLRLVLEASVTRWSAVENLTASLENTALLLQSTSQVDRHAVENLPLGIAMRDHLSAQVGLETEPWPGRLTLRTGYAYHRGATRPEAPSSVLMDLDHHVWAFGADVRSGPIRLGVALAHCFTSNVDTDGADATLPNPLDPAVTTLVGAGRYTTSRVRILFEAGIGW